MGAKDDVGRPGLEEVEVKVAWEVSVERRKETWCWRREHVQESDHSMEEEEGEWVVEERVQ